MLFFYEVQAPEKFKISSQTAKNLLWVFLLFGCEHFSLYGKLVKGLEVGERSG